MEQPTNTPFLSLGNKLKSLRQKVQESLAEVSGAVEIDVEVLKRFEHGAERPSEDVLMLLISHFNMSDDEAVRLMQLAGYDSLPRGFDGAGAASSDLQPRSVMMMLALDTRILYSDGAHIAADKNGVVFSFSQNGGEPGSQRLPIARIGMSYNQAREFLQVLGQTLAKADALRQPKILPAPNPQSSKDKKSGSN